MKTDSISVVIPAFNEEETIKDVVRDATLILKKLKVDYEIVLVNDGSTDNTGKIIDKLAHSKKVFAHHHKKNKGFTGAMKTAFASAHKHWIFLAPADGQFDFSELPKFIEAIRGHDVATGYRVSNEERVSRKIKAIIFHLPYLFLNRKLLRINLREFSTVSLWRERVVQSIEIESEDRSAMFLPEVISKAMKQKYSFVEVPINWRGRKGGKAKGTSLLVAIKSLFGILRLWYTIQK
ncbi:MAG: glycosyltransferase family 2 protein [Patescibacteria group bacterium]